MTRLTKTELKFLVHHEVPLSRVYDATGKKKSEYKVIMSTLGLWVAYGVTACKAQGHKLRARSGHCVQCKPANLSYIRRHDEAGEIYVAMSNSGRLIKVGTSQNALERIQQLNYYAYGGKTDWEHCYIEKSMRAGLVETRVHQALSMHSANGLYTKDGFIIECRELFSCSPRIAITALKKYIATVEKS